MATVLSVYLCVQLYVCQICLPRSTPNLPPWDYVMKILIGLVRESEIPRVTMVKLQEIINEQDSDPLAE
jgi:hypothetical protein